MKVIYNRDKAVSFFNALLESGVFIKNLIIYRDAFIVNCSKSNRDNIDIRYAITKLGDDKYTIINGVSATQLNYILNDDSSRLKTKSSQYKYIKLIVKYLDKIKINPMVAVKLQLYAIVRAIMVKLRNSDSSDDIQKFSIKKFQMFCEKRAKQTVSKEEVETVLCESFSYFKNRFRSDLKIRRQSFDDIILNLQGENDESKRDLR